MTGGSTAPGPATTAKPGGTGNPAGSSQAAGRPRSRRLAGAPGVTAHSGPFPVTWTVLPTGHTTGSAEVEGRRRRTVRCRSTEAAARQLGPTRRSGRRGRLRKHARPPRRRSAQPRRHHVPGRRDGGHRRHPRLSEDLCARPRAASWPTGSPPHNPGLIWATQADAARIAGPPDPTPTILNLKLNDPSTAPAFADRYNADSSPAAPYLLSWQTIRDGDAQDARQGAADPLVGSWLLALLAVASVAVLVGGRMAEQTRRVGLLKAVGRHTAAGRRRAAVRTYPDRPVRCWPGSRRRLAGGTA